MKCEVCGVNEATTTASIGWHVYGVRTVQKKKLCRSCYSAHKRGEL